MVWSANNQYGDDRRKRIVSPVFSSVNDRNYQLPCPIIVTARCWFLRKEKKLMVCNFIRGRKKKKKGGYLVCRLEIEKLAFYWQM